MSANLRYDPNLSSFYLASAHAENLNASLVIEFVIYSKNSMAPDVMDRADKGNQVTVAWAHIELNKLSTKAKQKLDLKGGNPFREQELITEEDAEKQKAESKGFLKKIFGGNSNEQKQVERYLTLEVKQFNKLTE